MSRVRTRTGLRTGRRAGAGGGAGAGGTGRGAARGAAACAAIAVLAGGCGSIAAGSAAPARSSVSLPLATSLSAGQTTWAVIPMGAASGPNLFWQLFKLPAGAASWALATPPDVATNGAIAMGVQAGQSLVAGIHPSLHLDFSPITSTSDGGRTWSIGTPGPGLASVPDALATGPLGGQLIALSHGGSAELSRGGTSSWSTLISTTALAATAAGRACQLTGLTAAAFEPSGPPVLGGSCHHPGVAGVFAYRGGTWQAAGPPLPGSLRAGRTQVLRLTRTGSRLTVVLQAGAGPAARLLTAWTAGSTWTLSAPLRLTGRSVVSSSFGSTGGTILVLSGGHGELLAGPGTSWQQLPKLPPGRTVTLALPPGGGVDALAATGSILAVWRLQPGQNGATWIKAQQATVPIQYGSSG